ncbi:MAG: hypothetical protein JFR38_09525 [Muribaculaceae bacterium]|nr:hypothetical protein [Muribaculaceae bacterium]
MNCRCLLIAMLAAVAACKGPEGGADLADGTLARVGLECLTRTDLAHAMPAGLAPDDSTRFARAFIRNWIDTQLVDGVAAEQVDMEEVEAMVAQYRRDLIMRRYRDRMFATDAGAVAFSDSVVDDYYARHSADFVLERPLIRGVYIKVPDEAPELPQIRRLYRSTKPADIDRLEKAVLGSAIHYDYFRDNWIDWEQVEARVPYDFGGNPSDYVRSHRNLDVSLGGFTYLLEISDVMPAGAVMPRATARPLIEERLTAERRRAYDAALRERLFDSALSSGRLRLNCDLGL